MAASTLYPYCLLVCGAALFLCTVAVYAQCPADKFGSNCQYDCHCGQGVSCDNEDGCQGDCSQPWSGPTCQRENVALNKNATQSSTFKNNNGNGNAENAVNGDLRQEFNGTACSLTTVSNGPVFWSVALGKVYTVSRFKIYNRHENTCDRARRPCGYRLNGFAVKVGISSTGQNQLCYQDQSNSIAGPGAIINESCTTPIRGDTVRIELRIANRLALCEVLVYVCSAGWYGDMCDKRCSSETRCTRCDGAGLTCEECVHGSHGEDCELNCGRCWNNGTCSKTNGECPVTSNSPRCEAGYRGTNCSQECEDGSWAPDCSQSCGRCRDGSACNKQSGECPTRGDNRPCDSGYLGIGCDRRCQSGTWGDNCANDCSTTCMDLKCEIENGFCESGCKPGYMGKFCEVDCEDGTWGPDCSRRCGRCLNGSACNKRSGECIPSGDNHRCAAGYLGVMCNRSCDLGTWGDNCANNCSSSCMEGTCDVENGLCQPYCPESRRGNTVRLSVTTVTVVCVVALVVFVTLVVVIIILARDNNRQRKRIPWSRGSYITPVFVGSSENRESSLDTPNPMQMDVTGTSNSNNNEADGRDSYMSPVTPDNGISRQLSEDRKISASFNIYESVVD